MNSVQCIIFYITHLYYCYFIIIALLYTTMIENAKKKAVCHSVVSSV